MNWYDAAPKKRSSELGDCCLRKLLIISYHFPPSAASGSFRLLGFVRHLQKFGWSSDVVAAPSTPWEGVDPGLAERIPAETTVYHVRFPYGPIARRLVAFTGYSIWLPLAWPVCKRLVASGRYDAVLTSGPPHGVHLLGNALKKRYGIPWVADFRDPWSGNKEGGPKIAQWGDRWVSAQEPDAIRRADTVVANAPKVAEEFRAAFPEAADRIVTITNGYDPEEFAGGGETTADSDSNAGRFNTGEVTLVHSGAIYLGRDPRPLLDAIRVLNSAPEGPRFRLRLLGSFDSSQVDLPAEIASRGLESAVDFLGQVSYSQTLREMKTATILVLLDSPGRQSGVPAKLYEYIGATRPILALAEAKGDLAWVLEESGVPSRIASTSDSDDIRRALQELVQEMAHRDPAASPPAPVFTRERLTARLAEVLDGIVKVKK